MKQTMKDQVKKAIQIAIDFESTTSFSVKRFKEISEAAQIKCSIDTVRNAVKEMVEAGGIEKVTLEDGSIGYMANRPKLVPNKKTRGWKMEAIRTLVSQGKKVDRYFLARSIQSDERNTHIMVSKINENPQKWNLNIQYDKTAKAYFV